MKRILITGGTGLLGRAILHELSHFSFTLTATARPTSIKSNLPDGIRWLEVDLEDQDSVLVLVEQNDIVIHSAGKVSFDPKEDLSFNVNSTKNLVEACMEAERRLIHISSVSTLGSVHDIIINEQSDFSLNDPTTKYARSKYFAELEVWRGIAEGLEAVILNPSIILGIPIDFKNSSGALWTNTHKGMPFYPKGSTGFVDARDVALIIRKLVDSEIQGERFVISAENWSYKTFLDQVASEIDVISPKRRLPYWLSSLLWQVGGLARLIGVTLPFSKAMHLIINSDKQFDSSKIQHALNFKFRPVDESISWVSRAFLESNR